MHGASQNHVDDLWRVYNLSKLSLQVNIRPSVRWLQVRSNAPKMDRRSRRQLGASDKVGRQNFRRTNLKHPNISSNVSFTSHEPSPDFAQASLQSEYPR